MYDRRDPSDESSCIVILFGLSESPAGIVGVGVGTDGLVGPDGPADV